MPELSIAITGTGRFFHMWPSHAGRRFPRATIYDRSAAVTAFRQAEADLGHKGLLDKEGQEMAKRITENLANPPVVDATLTFKGNKVTVTCKNGNEKRFLVYLTGVDERSVNQTFFHVDAAITRCSAAVPMT